MEKIRMMTPLVEMDGDDPYPVEDDQRGIASSVC